MNMLKRWITGLALLAAMTAGAAAQDLPKSNFKVIGLNSPTPVSIHDEVPFWRKTIPEASKGAVTAVPTSAVSLAADGTSRVLVNRGGTSEYVTVQPGLSTGGYVEVSAVDGQLLPGQLVVVGLKALDLEGIK